MNRVLRPLLPAIINMKRVYRFISRKDLYFDSFRMISKTMKTTLKPIPMKRSRKKLKRRKILQMEIFYQKLNQSKEIFSPSQISLKPKQEKVFYFNEWRAGELVVEEILIKWIQLGHKQT